MSELLIAEFERFVRRDPGGRGLIGPDADCGIGAGELFFAAQELAKHGRSVGLVTGFFIPITTTQAGHDRSDPPAGFAETDGPLGTALLAAVLQQLEIDVNIITDTNCEAVVRRAAVSVGLSAHCVLAAPLQSNAWRESFWRSEFGRSLSHLVAIERVGPSHTRESLLATGANAETLQEFETAVPLTERGRCYNMRGVAIDEFTGDLHCLFDEFTEHLPRGQTVSVGDGGNEIGMGRFDWSVLRQRLSSEVGAKIPCRIATKHTVVAGTSNWGAYALAAAVALLRGRIDVLVRHSASTQFETLTNIVHETRAVDGVTRRHDATVDGLPFLTYIQPWIGIRQLLELPP